MTRIRVLLSGGADDVGRALADDCTPVDAPPADLALAVIDGEVDDGAVAAVSALRDRADAPVIAVVSASPTPRKLRALVAAADGVVERRAVDRTLAAAVEAVRCGLAVLPAAMYQALERPPLSNREKQILAMVVLGFSNAEIAGKLVVTESTVKNHLSSAFAKLGVRSRNAATSLLLDPATGLGLGVLQLSGADD